jgi:tryptophanyl-tRNA synthetase
MEPAVKLQDQGEAFYFIADYHAMTSMSDADTLRENVWELAIDFLACGLDPEKATIFRQSDIPEVNELAWILSTVCPMGLLQRCHSYKDKIDRGMDANHALFAYPALMAADILLYGATYVPVGDDQRQHLELTRDLAQRLNNKFEQELFTIPVAFKEQLEFYSRDTGLRIRSLRSPENKMSKSISDPAGTILLSDSPEEARKKIMSATTDSVGAVHYDFDTQPGVSNLLQILATITNESQSAVNSEWEGNERYGDLKQATADATANFLESFQERLSNVDESQLLEKLEQGEAAMREVANATLLRVQKAVGLKPVY